MNARPSAPALIEGVEAGDRAMLARAITIVESSAERDQALARQILEGLAPGGKAALRVGVSGVPGVGKSSFLEALGTRLCAAGKRVAVLAVDPSSARSGGSILGDKTRMTELSRHPSAFVRPSPSRGELGGVARRTREALRLCEAAGFDVVFVETVGVGQSEAAVRELVDTFLLLMLGGAGDELQGIKRGILELADLMAVNKADGEFEEAAKRARDEYQNALKLLAPSRWGWKVPVMTCSAHSGEGIDEVWSAVLDHRTHLQTHGHLEEQRAQQRRRALWRDVESRLVAEFRRHPQVASALETARTHGWVMPEREAQRLIALFRGQAEPED